MGVESLITLIIIILLIGLLFYALRWMLGQMAVPQPMANIILLIVAIVVLLWLLQRYGLVTTPGLLPMAGNPQSGGSG